jgi:hypothetical protein
MAGQTTETTLWRPAVSLPLSRVTNPLVAIPDTSTRTDGPGILSCVLPAGRRQRHVYLADSSLKVSNSRGAHLNALVAVGRRAGRLLAKVNSRLCDSFHSSI